MRHELTLTTTDGAETVILSVPTSWMDVSLQQFIDWQCSTDSAACCLAGITQEQLDRLPWQDAGYLMNLLHFAATLPESEPSPDLMDPGSASYGQMMLVQARFEEYPDKPDIWHAPYLYALYRSQQIFKRYDEQKLQAMHEAILQEPVTNCLGDVLFFSAAWWISSNATPPTPKTLPSPTMTSSTPAWKKWAAGLGRFLPSMRWPRPSAAAGPSSTNSTPTPSSASSG
ncbi:hypothetical protein [Hymenobacter cellulosivorans]|uniref:Uncharacterized protein n=1 Tax=Hymenobacter cellulosivorans TaxID=2932249 RepID=A0ABY4FF41_9BACT|nr:hypothetical protein [Hymenobacter cellulosivorans]UOQ53066.1 hypothetical protein MUN80_25430 [Hymenobacter cellulosivorans]